jgi:hypothetical protein
LSAEYSLCDQWLLYLLNLLPDYGLSHPTSSSLSSFPKLVSHMVDEA